MVNYSKVNTIVSEESKPKRRNPNIAMFGYHTYPPPPHTQFKSPVIVKPEYFVVGEIKIPMRGKLNAPFRDELLKKKMDIKAFITFMAAISMALLEEARIRRDILEVYEVVKSVTLPR